MAKKMTDERARRVFGTAGLIVFGVKPRSIRNDAENKQQPTRQQSKNVEPPVEG